MPWYDAKLYASTQVVDEARHVEVFARYLDEKLGGHYQINAHLRMLLDDIVNDSRWDMTYLGMQVMVEGLALAAFGFMHQLTGEPLLKQLLRYVMSDEARHVAFGVLSLKEVYDGHDRSPRSRTARSSPSRPPCACATGSCQQEVWERMGINPREVVPLVLPGPDARPCSSRCCSPRSSPTARSSACSTATTRWLRRRFEEMGVIQFEDWADTGEEYLQFELGQDAPRTRPRPDPLLRRGRLGLRARPAVWPARPSSSRRPGPPARLFISYGSALLGSSGRVRS